MRPPQRRAAVIETARGGILRRGIAVSHAQVALVTNVSADHFGEYGIDDLEGLADVKLSVAGVLSDGATLVLNAGDAQLASRAPGLARFGASIEDNFGRLMRFERCGVRILVDYAHNPADCAACSRWQSTCAAVAAGAAQRLTSMSGQRSDRAGAPRDASVASRRQRTGVSVL